jgi:scyllo-inositol 2-dehydrogenase (NADP+)
MKDNPIRTAVLSYGMSGEVFHAPLINALPQFDLHTIMQRSSDRAKEHYPRVRIVRTVEEIFSDESIELVVVNTPNETHHRFAMQALRAGKHVIVEKPFTVTTQEADDLISEAERRGRVLTVFQNRRWDSDYLTVKKVLHEGELGPVVEFEAHYDRFRNYIEPNTWKEERTRGTGILYNLGSHMLDQIVDLFGLPHYVDARIGVQRPGGRVDDFYDIRLEYDGLLVIVKSSYLVKEQGPRYRIHGVNGSFIKHGTDLQEQALKAKQDPLDKAFGVEPEHEWGKLNVLRNGASLEMKVPSERGDYTGFYANIYDSIRLGAPLAVDPRQVRNVIALIESCYRSSKNKCAVKIEQ